MGRVRDIPRTAAFAWSTNISSLSLATGTRAGAVDADFSSDTKLELWDLDITDQNQEAELQPAGSLSTDARLFDLAWSKSTSDRTEGIIAGALENGSLDLWDAAKLRTDPSDARISRTEKHSGAIKSLQFNPHRAELLATAGAKGELYITDLNNASNPFRLGQATARPEDFDALDWNKQVAHIMATGGSNGFVTVWDVKAKKESLTLNNYGRKPVSSVAWNPDLPTKLATAVPSDTDPLILMWDLRNSSAPERILKGHEQGVLSLSWCQQDSSLLLSCGKDNRNICWNPHTGEAVGEFPIVTNWTFQTQWHPRQPNFLATASFDGKIAIETIQSTNSQQDKPAQANQAADGADFFAKAHSAPVGASFSLAKPPKWLSRPSGAAFGFGGKLVTFKPDSDGVKSKVNISTFASDPSVDKSIAGFAEALDNKDLEKVCKDKVEASTSEDDRKDWSVIQTLVSDSPRKGLLAYLGFEDEAKAQDQEQGTERLKTDSHEDGQVNGFAETKSNRLSSFFDTGADSDNFLADLAASKGAKTNRPFNIFNGSESDAEKKMTRALMLGSFEDALDICLKENRMSDAFMIAICGGQKCVDKAQTAYFAQQSNAPNYLRLLASIVGKNLWDVVYNADLENWSEVMATLCTFADETEFPDLCEALGDRLDESSESRKHASFCYLAGSKLEKVVPIWLNQMQEVENTRAEASQDESAFSVHVQALQFFIEKVAIFTDATEYVDKEREEKSSGWRLEPLYGKYAEYADVVAAYGHMDLAQKYLALLPSQYATAEIARNRVQQATKKPATQQRPAATARTMPALATSAGSAPGFAQPAPIPQPTPATPSQRSAYAPPSFPQPQHQQPSSSSAYAPPNAFSNAYQPAPQPPAPSQAPSSLGPPQSGPPPPRNPPSGAYANGSWNDLPDSFQRKAPISRSATPSYGGVPVTSPFPNQSNAAPSMTSAPPQRSASPLPPPPRAGAPHRITSPLNDRPSSQDRPNSSSLNAYSPAAPPPRGASPYNAPPATAPPSNRYAPAPGAVTSAPSGGYGPPATRQIAPSPYAAQPPQQQPHSQYGALPPSQYGAPPPSQYGAPQQSQYGPPQTQQMPVRPPSQAPPPASKPPLAPPPKSGPPPRGGPPPTSRTGTPSASKYPSGDRSQIPPESLQTYEQLNTEMQRIRRLAPAQYKAQVDDTEKRLNLLFDALNNDDVKAEHAALLRTVAGAIQARSFEQAQATADDLTKQLGTGVLWMVGLQRLIKMSKATPVS